MLRCRRPPRDFSSCLSLRSDRNFPLSPDLLSAAGHRENFSSCMVIKTHIPRIGSKFGPDEFRINSGYMSFYNHITTVFLGSRGS